MIERYRRNVAALEKTLPEDLKPSDITARLGAPWIPADVVAAFAEDVLGVKDARLSHGRDRELVDQCPCLRGRSRPPRPTGARPVAMPASS